MRLREMSALPGARPPARRACALAALALVGSVAQAQQRGSTISVVPTFTAQETITTNVNLSATDKKSEAITQISPGVEISSRAGSVQGTLSYSLNALIYARDSRKNSQTHSLQNGLNAAFQVTAVEGVAFVDVSARVSQQAQSAFGTQTPGTVLDGGNTTEVSTLSVSPSARARLGGDVDATGRVSYSITNSASTDAGDSNTLSAQLGLSRRSGYFGWALDSSRTVSDFKAGRKSTSDSAGATLQLFPVYELQLSLRGGWEASDAQGGGRRSNNTWGWGVDYRPGPRTSLSLQSDHRFFGQSHTFTASHRMGHSVWSYVDTRDVNTPGGINGQQVLTVYDLFKLMCLRRGGDAASCDAEARATVSASGLQPNDLPSGGFLSSALTLQRSQRLSMAYSALRSTFTLSGFRTATSRLDNLVVAGEDLSQADVVRQQGFSAGASHRLTPSASLSLSLSQQKTLNAGSLAGNTLRSALLSWNDRLGRTITTSLSLRRTLAASETNPYNESAVIGSISLRF